MAAKTPDANSLVSSVAGDLRVELTTFATVSDGDTYRSGLAQVLGWSWDGGSSAPTCGLTVAQGSGTTPAIVTFKVTSGPAVTSSLVLWGR